MSVKQLKYWRNELSHAAPEKVKVITKYFDDCITLVRKAAEKHTPSLIPNFDAKVKVFRDKKFFRENSKAWNELQIELVCSKLDSCSLACRSDSAFSPIGSDFFQQKVEACMLPSSQFNPRHLSGCAQDMAIARLVSKSAAACSSDPEYSDASTLGTLHDSSESDSDCERIAVHINRPISTCSSCMQLLEAYIAGYLSEDCATLFCQAKDCIESNAQLVQLIRDICADQEVPSTSLQSEHGLAESPTVKILTIMLQKGIPPETPTKKRQDVFRTCMSRVRCEIHFMDNVEKLARSGFFSVERAITANSHVAFLCMNKFAAWVFSKLLQRFPCMQQALVNAGINFVHFGLSEHGKYFLGPLTVSTDAGSASAQGSTLSTQKEQNPSTKEEGTDHLTTLKKLLKYCHQVVTKKDEFNDNVMEKVVFYGQDFEGMGLQASNSEGWFCVEESPRCKRKVPCPSGTTSQRQLFMDLLKHNRRSKVDGGELICGIGIVRHQDTNRKIWHPVILIHLDIEERNGQLFVSPSRTHGPALWSMSPLCAGGERDQYLASQLEKEFQDFLKNLEARTLTVSPFNRSTFEPFLDNFRRCWNGQKCTIFDAPIRPSSDNKEDVDFFWEQLNGRPLELVDEWVIYGQDGDLSASKKDIQSFIAQLDSDTPSCQAPPWAAFLARKLADINLSSARMEVTYGHAGVASETGTDEWLFPLDCNDQQQEIAEFLRHRHTVVVQGPPGTGKTHTLANVISDALAQGLRVLVVSTGQDALEVMFKMLPKFVKSVAMLFRQGQDQAQAIRAVEAVRKTVEESRSPAQAIADKELHEQELMEGRRRRGRLEADLDRRAELLLRPLAQPLKKADNQRWEQLVAACEWREKIRVAFDHDGASYLRRQNIMTIVLTLFRANEARENEPEWLIDLPAVDREVLKRQVLDEGLPLLARVCERDLYKELKSTQAGLLHSAEKLVELRLKDHIVASHKRSPAMLTIINLFLTQLQLGQSKGRGHQIRHWRMAQEILAQEQVLIKAFPLWIMTTSMVSELLPSQFGLFDVVAVDEASKAEIFELPSLLRGERLLVIGDNKQVSPNDVTIPERRLHELRRHLSTVAPSAAVQSAFEPGKSIFDLFFDLHILDVKMLREHFRCTQAIIRFCNENFYKGELEALRMSTRAKRLTPPIKCNFHRRAGSEAEGGKDLSRQSPTQDFDSRSREDLRQMAIEKLKEECKVRASSDANSKTCFSRCRNYGLLILSLNYTEKAAVHWRK